MNTSKLHLLNISSTSKKIEVAEGRNVYRHPTAPGSVLEFYDIGTEKQINLLVFDASYSINRKWSSFVTDENHDDIPELTNVDINNSSHNRYIDGWPRMTGEDPLTTTTAATLTETNLNKIYSKSYIDNHTAAENYKFWSAYAGGNIISALPTWNGQKTYVPNKQEAIRMYCSALAIDSLDPTVSSNSSKSLTSWFNSGNMWTSSEYTNGTAALCISYLGTLGFNDKTTVYWVRPVLEL